ncbi:exodeoxyribonuclease V subunit gamma [Rhodococcus sp. NPDC058521]|uniref:exodeoxyribonuclease V subunit gamma n=1 Tax=Rhodococcus sp. NPDC058521 TaxID=3346536 RepID=UPI00365FC90D
MLRLHRAERSSTLADALAELLAAPQADPFAGEVVAVPARGVERWLTQRLATVLGAEHADGIAANIAFPGPNRLVDDAVSAVSEMDARTDPWSSNRMLWKVLEVIDTSTGEPWYPVLGKHLEGHRIGRRYETALHLAELFRGYAAQRPSMLVDWANGADTDGAGGPLDGDLTWQAALWRGVRERIGSPSLAERLRPTCDRLREDPDAVPLPERLSLFGTTRLTTAQLEVVQALSAHRDIHVWLTHPSPRMWERLSASIPVVRRREDDSALLVQNPLSASLSRDVRELQARLSGITMEDVHHPGSPSPGTLLGAVQQAVVEDRYPESLPDPDGTLEVHACHGPSRQVEVLREDLLRLFQDNPGLEPRDVLILCPDVEAYAPLIRAAFGQGVLGHPGHRLRVRLADRGLRQTNPVLAVLDSLLQLADERVTASSVLDLAAAPPVRRRFGFGDDELERLREWVHESGARWGIGLRQRATFGLEGFPQNTFVTAIDRLLLGVTADESESEWLDLALPLDDVESTDIELAGCFAEFVDRLAVTLRDLEGPRPASEWVTVLRRSLQFLVDVPQSDSWQLGQALRELSDAMEHGGETRLSLPDVRAMFTSRTAPRPTRANFRTGELTVCTMVPMRSVPHRVVALLGLDDEVFPRKGSLDGDDVTGRDPCIGERDPRSEDRQLLLDALMSAGDHLLLFFTGSDPVTGAERPPAIPLSGVLDMVGEGVICRHPLQPFDTRNFDPTRPASFDMAALAGARASLCEPAGAPANSPSLPYEPLPPRVDTDVDLSDLVSFVVDPTRAFLRQRLGIRVAEIEEDVADALDLELDGLAKWSVGERMLHSRLRGVSPADFRATEWRRGTLPPFALGAQVLQEIEAAVDALSDATLPLLEAEAETVDVALDLGDGRRLVGTVTGVHDDCIVRTSFSKLAAKHRLTAWVQMLAVAAAVGRPVRALTTGRGSRNRFTWRSSLHSPGGPIAHLRALVEMRDEGLRFPLPIAPRTTAAYAERRFRGDTEEEARAAAEREWSGMYGEATDLSIGYVFGEGVSLSEFAPDSTTFSTLAYELWSPLLAVETQGRP